MHERVQLVALGLSPEPGQENKGETYPSKAGLLEMDGEEMTKRIQEIGGPLNPQWVEWLMGYPVGWTDCAVSETPSSRKSSSQS